MLAVNRNGKLLLPLKDAYEKMMIASKSFKQTADLENMLLEALIWPLAV